jgi:hypothetical protein
MSSLKQQEANRMNAKKSTGPTTEAGKRRSSLNAVRHGLTGQVVILPEEEMEAFNRFVIPLAASLKMPDAPDDLHEIQLAEMYAKELYRINRCASMEDAMLTLGVMEEVAEHLNIENPEAHNATTYAKTFRNESKAFDRLGIYHQRLISGAKKILAQLKACQAERRQRLDQALTEAARLYQFHRMQSQAFDPSENGFVLTVAEIKAHIRLVNLTKQAEIAESVKYNATLYQKRAA